MLELECSEYFEPCYSRYILTSHWPALISISVSLQVFLSPRVWRCLTLSSTSFTNRRFNMDLGYQREISHHRVQMCMSKVGRNVRTMTILPFTDFFNLGGFLNVMASFLSFFNEYPMPNLRTFNFTFACEIRAGHEVMIIGTGGQLLKELKLLLSRLQSLEKFKLNHLLLDNNEAIGILDGIAKHSTNTMLKLEVLNCTKIRYPLFALASFHNLRYLTITPNHVTNDVLLLIVRRTKLNHLVLVQDKHTNDLESVSSHVWSEVKCLSPDIRVDLEYYGNSDSDILIQERAPVRSITYNTPHVRVRPEKILSISEHYHFSLCSYIHLQIPRIYSHRSFNERADSSLVLLIRECPNLHTLALNCKLSTCTVLVMAMESKCLQRFYIRRHAVLLRRDWPMCRRWSRDQYDWLMKSSLNYYLVEREVSQILCRRWTMLCDKQYKALTLRL